MRDCLDALHDGFWKFVGAAKNDRPPHVAENTESRLPTHLDVDVRIITNCSFPGGNAATTITEARTFIAAGLSVGIVNCSIKKSRWKWNWIPERYLPLADHIISTHHVRNIKCRTAIKRLIRRVEPDHAIFVVNNSAWNEDGGEALSSPELHKFVGALDWPSVELCPTGPIIREESARDLAGTGIGSQMSVRDWPPVIDETEFDFAPRETMESPIVIGRHARDHPGKWLEDRFELLAVYPADDPDIKVLVLGGAETVEQSLGGVPDGWEVLPFGFDGVQDYLRKLDIFVNFPSPARHEAFGRTIVEAVLSGRPVIFHPRFERTFGDLAFYCMPHDVRGVIERLAADNAGRLAYLHAARDLASDLFCAPSVVKRLEKRSGPPHPALQGEIGEWRRSILPQA